jgi:hypothetical protein
MIQKSKKLQRKLKIRLKIITIGIGVSKDISDNY